MLLFSTTCSTMNILLGSHALLSSDIYIHVLMSTQKPKIYKHMANVCVCVCALVFNRNLKEREKERFTTKFIEQIFFPNFSNLFSEICNQLITINVSAM